MQLTINSQKHQKFASVVYLSFFFYLPVVAYFKLGFLLPKIS